MNHSSNTLIAIADDHTLFRNLLVRTINEVPNFTVIIQAQNGEDLIAQIQQCKLKIDVCLLDINMPVKNGYDTAFWLKSEMPEIKVLALSMFTDGFPVIQMLANGACGFVAKDAEPIELIKAINHVHQLGYYYSGVIEKHLPNGIHSLVYHKIDITCKEMQFLKLCSTSMTYIEMATVMNVSKRTIENYRDSLFKKMDVHSRVGLAVLAINAGL